ncbi:metal-dependent hydrolase family protein [Algoriphagus boritolerans]|uniref:Imidazolonepropionase n=1 Tax=Algoriphagus boritolerans DSM 17298 = JCM 18970 TaxID=1120964 RepID=A0A1H5VQE8_9BACT|nr:amidohydrolase family protein [Algoriphagus boritolerans]SEF89454.1 Imidazolonepropionase [Algoriphagus boritolerans DSM 17298 = JCM 18970]
MKTFKRSIWILTLVLVTLSQNLFAQNKILLINNVEIFNGSSENTIQGNILIEGNTISRISTAPIPTNKSANVQLIDGKGKFLMPGLIDAHYHAMFSSLSQIALLTSNIGFVNLVAGKNAENLLMKGFTSIRDLGGPVFGLKQAIDNKVIPGPRIWPSGAFISQTGGHGDFRLPNEIPSDPSNGLTYAERINAAALADSPDAVRLRVREQLMLGASQIKLMAGGGVSSIYDPLDVTQYTEAEIRAAVEAAENWGTYVTVHAYTPKAIQQAIRAGVKCIDHGQLIDEETVKMMVEKNIFWSLQPFVDEGDKGVLSPESRAKQLEMYQGTDTAFELAKKYDMKIAYGTDVLFDAQKAAQPGLQLVKMKRWFSNFQILQMATANNAQLLELSGKRSPYSGKLGVIAEGALADLILVDGNLIQNLELITEPEKNILLVIKDGVIYKNILK